MYTHFASPIFLLAFFLIAFTAHSIATASSTDATVTPSLQTGPGGKPLPENKTLRAKAQQKKRQYDFSPARKQLFNWLSVGTILTFLANAAIVISHALLDRKENWWCGQHVAVS